MQCDSVAFSVTYYRPKPVRSDGVFLLENFSSACLDGSNRIVQPALDAQVNQRAMLGGLVVLRLDQAPGNIFIGVRQESEFHAWHGLLGNRCSKNSGIELDGSIEVIDRNVGPTDGVALTHVDTFLLDCFGMRGRSFPYAELSGKLHSSFRNREPVVRLLTHKPRYAYRL